MSKIITHTLSESTTSNEATVFYLIADTGDGKTELVISKTFTERYSLQEYEKAESLFKRLTGGNGRRAWTLEELINGF